MRFLKYAILALFLVAVVLLLAFGPRPASKRPKDRVVIEYWEKWTGKEGDQMEEIVNDFNHSVGKDKGIWVEYLSQSTPDLKILIATNAGVPPDIAGIWDNQLSAYAAIDALEPLDELAQSHGITPDYYKKIFWDPCHYHGKLYALVSTPASTALHWNKRVFLEHAAQLQAAGCDPTRAPQTLDELVRYSHAMVERAPQKPYPIIAAGFVPQEPGWYILQIPFWFGGELYDQKTGTLTLNSPQCVAAYDWIRGFSVRLGGDDVMKFHQSSGNFDSPQNRFLTGQVAMCLQGPWMGNYIEKLKPQMNAWKHPLSWNDGKTPEERASNYEWAVAPFPSVQTEALMKQPGFKQSDLIDQGVTWCASDMLAIPRGSKHVKEAFEFIAYVNRQDVMEKICSLHCKNTPLAQHSDHWYLNHPNPYVDIFDRLASSPNARTLPPIATWPQVSDELKAVVDRVGQMQQSPQAALDAAQSREQDELNLFRKRHPETPPATAATQIRAATVRERPFCQILYPLPSESGDLR